MQWTKILAFQKQSSINIPKNSCISLENNELLLDMKANNLETHLRRSLLLLMAAPQRLQIY